MIPTNVGTGSGMRCPDPENIGIGSAKAFWPTRPGRLPTLFNAWNVYASIRSTYHPERAPGLFLLAERIHFLIQLNYTWHSILNYILTFFREFQNSDSEKWTVLDGVLVAHQFSVSQQKQTPAHNKADGGTGKSKKSTSISRVPISEQTCNNWNNEKFKCKFSDEDCHRRHKCSTCGKPGHEAFRCPSK